LAYNIVVVRPSQGFEIVAHFTADQTAEEFAQTAEEKLQNGDLCSFDGTWYAWKGNRFKKYQKKLPRRVEEAVGEIS